jgi:hypothetical protein
MLIGERRGLIGELTTFERLSITNLIFSKDDCTTLNISFMQICLAVSTGLVEREKYDKAFFSPDSKAYQSLPPVGLIFWLPVIDSDILVVMPRSSKIRWRSLSSSLKEAISESCGNALVETMSASKLRSIEEMMSTIVTCRFHESSSAAFGGVGATSITGAEVVEDWVSGSPVVVSSNLPPNTFSSCEKIVSADSIYTSVDLGCPAIMCPKRSPL